MNARESELAQARELLLEYGRFVIAQPGAASFCFGALESEAARAYRSATRKRAAVVSWTWSKTSLPVLLRGSLEPSTEIVRGAWELKGLWVRPIARGLGLDRTLVLAVLARAVVAGRKGIYLDTALDGCRPPPLFGPGFVPCAPYNDNPVEGLAYLVNLL